MKMEIRVTIERDEDGIYVIDCPSIPGCISQGPTKEEAMMNMHDAVRGCLEVRAEQGMPEGFGEDPFNSSEFVLVEIWLRHREDALAEDSIELPDEIDFSRCVIIGRGPEAVAEARRRSNERRDRERKVKAEHAKDQ